MSLAADITTELAYLTRELKADPCVAHALALRAAWALGNYHRFFRLYAHAPCMSGYLVDKFADRERKAALKAMIKTYVKLISALALPSAPLPHPGLRPRPGHPVSSPTCALHPRLDPLPLRSRPLPSCRSLLKAACTPRIDPLSRPPFSEASHLRRPRRLWAQGLGLTPS